MNFTRLSLLSVVAFLVLIERNVSAQPTNYSIPWSVISSGSGTTTGGVFALRATIGQSDAHRREGGSYVMQGGFWSFLLDSNTNPPAPPTNHNGIAVTALGAAKLASQAGSLVVSNIGGSGMDGFSVPVTGTNGASVTWMDRDPVTLANGAEMKIRVFGTLNGVANSPLMVAGFPIVNPIFLQPDYSPLGATSYTLVVYQNASVVFVLSNRVGMEVTNFVHLTGSNIVGVAAWLDDDQRPGWHKLTPLVLDGGPLRTVFEWPGSWDITIPGHGTVRGDRLELLPEFVGPPPTVGPITELELTAARFGELVFYDLNGTTRPLLHLGRVGAQGILSWYPPIGTLQRAPTVLGPWTDTPGISGAVTNDLAAPQQFYRVRQ